MLTYRRLWCSYPYRALILSRHSQVARLISQFGEEFASSGQINNLRLDAPITKNSRAVAKQCAQAEILKEGTTPAF
jgi:hypothetical protein